MGLPFVTDLVKGVSDIVDELHTSEEEKLTAKGNMLSIYVKAAADATAYEAEIAKQAAATVQAEANGHSWMQRNWRPMIMLMFGYIVGHNYIVVPIVQMFGVKAPVLDLPPQLWNLLDIGIGGYVVGRSAEKIVPAAIAAFKAKDTV